MDAPGRHWNAHCYERDRIATQFSVSGTAPGHSLLWPGPRQDRTGTLITMAGTALRRFYYGRDHRDVDYYGRGHWDTHYYGRAHTGTLITMAGTDTPFGPYKVI